jgi:hypothetical protein
MQHDRGSDVKEQLLNIKAVDPFAGDILRLQESMSLIFVSRRWRLDRLMCTMRLEKDEKGRCCAARNLKWTKLHFISRVFYLFICKMFALRFNMPIAHKSQTSRLIHSD